LSIVICELLYSFPIMYAGHIKIVVCGSLIEGQTPVRSNIIATIAIKAFVSRIRIMSLRNLLLFTFSFQFVDFAIRYTSETAIDISVATLIMSHIEKNIDTMAGVKNDFPANCFKTPLITEFAAATRAHNMIKSGQTLLLLNIQILQQQADWTKSAVTDPISRVSMLLKKKSASLSVSP